MALNEDCVEKLMLYFEETISCDTRRPKPIRVKYIQIAGFSEGEIYAAAQFCAKSGYINGIARNPYRFKDIPPVSMQVTSIESSGYKFLELAHADGLLDKIKRSGKFSAICAAISAGSDLMALITPFL